MLYLAKAKLVLAAPASRIYLLQNLTIVLLLTVTFIIIILLLVLEIVNLNYI